MVCCVCGRDVAGLPVMRDNRTGSECCEACSFKLGGPAEFIRYVDSGKAIRGVQKAQKPAMSAMSQYMFREEDKKELKLMKSMDSAERQRYKEELEGNAKLADLTPHLFPFNPFTHKLELLNAVEKKSAKKKITTTPKKSFLDRIRGH